MPIFRISGKRVEKIKPTQFMGSEREKQLQNLIENNLDKILDMEFIATEHPTSHGGRIDTLQLHNEPHHHQGGKQESKEHVPFKGIDLFRITIGYLLQYRCPHKQRHNDHNRHQPVEYHRSIVISKCSHFSILTTVNSLFTGCSLERAAPSYNYIIN